MKNMAAKKTLQTLIYLPHFMSWAVVAGIFSMLLSPTSTGMVNGILKDLGVLEASGNGIYFLASKAWWRPIFYLINIWKETGWGTIIFLATLSGINPELYEAADIDGAGRMQKIWSVTVPALANTIITVLILNLAKVMNMFESVFVLYNDAVLDVSDVISTYIYRQTFGMAMPNYGYSTAVGLFKSLVGGFLVIVCNYASKKVRGRGIV
jgi:putative aldouronate transport system permease protein